MLKHLGRRRPVLAGYSAGVIDISDIENALQTVSDEAAKRLLSDFIETLLAVAEDLRGELQSARDENKQLKGLPARTAIGFATAVPAGWAPHPGKPMTVSSKQCFSSLSIPLPPLCAPSIEPIQPPGQPRTP